MLNFHFRLLYVFCDRDSVRAETAAAELLARVEHLKQLFPGATPTTTHNFVGGIGPSLGSNLLNTGSSNSLAFSSQTIGQQQQPQIGSTSQLIECSNSSLSSS